MIAVCSSKGFLLFRNFARKLLLLLCLHLREIWRHGPPRLSAGARARQRLRKAVKRLPHDGGVFFCANENTAAARRGRCRKGRGAGPRGAPGGRNDNSAPMRPGAPKSDGTATLRRAPQRQAAARAVARRRRRPRGIASPQQEQSK